jgi:hypothetical protein
MSLGIFYDNCLDTLGQKCYASFSVCFLVWHMGL